jgi:hypothetical protein
MYRAVTILLLLALLPAVCFAQAAPKGCFSKAEETAEQIVRFGLRLREGARACEGKPWDAHTGALWDQVDQRFGPRFAQQTEVRRRAFVREFSDDADNRLDRWNARTVMFYRNYPVSEVYCAEVKGQMEHLLKAGWSVATKASKVAADAVRMDYRICP